MKRALATTITAVAILLVSSAGYAEKRTHEGKIVSIDTGTMTMVVQGEKGDQWNLYWTESTKLQNGLTFGELKNGDKVHFDFMKKDGKMWVTELRRTKKADRD